MKNNTEKMSQLEIKNKKKKLKKIFKKKSLGNLDTVKLDTLKWCYGLKHSLAKILKYALKMQE